MRGDYEVVRRSDEEFEDWRAEQEDRAKDHDQEEEEECQPWQS